MDTLNPGRLAALRIDTCGQQVFLSEESKVSVEYWSKNVPG
jgi:hypothetical protein